MTTKLTQSAFSSLATSAVGRRTADLHLCWVEGWPLLRGREGGEKEVEQGVLDTSLVSFPQLRRLAMEGQGLVAIHLTSSCFPLLNWVSVELVGAVEYLNLDLPLLTHINLKHITLLNSEEFGASMSRSPKLQTIYTYKLFGLCEVEMSLPDCSHVNFMRSDGIKSFSLWAPKLEMLNLAASWPEKVDLLEAPLPPFQGQEYQFCGQPSTFLLNLYLCRRPGGSLVRSRRCRGQVQWPDSDEDLPQDRGGVY